MFVFYWRNNVTYIFFMPFGLADKPIFGWTIPLSTQKIVYFKIDITDSNDNLKFK